MCEHERVSREEFNNLVKRETKTGAVPRLATEAVQYHLKYSGEHNPSDKTEDLDLKVSHYAAILRGKLAYNQISVGVRKIKP